MRSVDLSKVIIVDGYNDEPAGLGVPPYLDVYARYAAGVIWRYNNNIIVHYCTIDELRKDFVNYLKLMNKSDILIVIGGVIVPGKYIGGEPITRSEVIKIGTLVKKPIKILCGPIAKYGFCAEGGKKAEPLDNVINLYDLIVKGDIEVVLTDLINQDLNVDKVDPNASRSNYDIVREVAVRGARIVQDHPNYDFNLICEIETYRGCPRYIAGGCSFCVEPLWGPPIFRPVEDIIREISMLYEFGVKHFRLGRQPDIYSYQAYGVGEKEFPRPNVDAIRKLFEGIRLNIPNLLTLHIDNVNPGTIANYPEESREITKIIVKCHTPGDVAAMGIESTDPKVIKANNLKVEPEDALKAIKIVNEIGSIRGWNGLPELLPGVNFVYGLIGENEETYRLNFEFMKKVLDMGLLIRRINIRQCIPLPRTKMWNVGNKIIIKNKRFFKIYKEKMRYEVDRPMLKKIAPLYLTLKKVFIEIKYGNITYGRQVGSYPLLVAIPSGCSLREIVDIMVVGHGYRSILGLPLPIKINKCEKKLLKYVPIFKGRSTTQIILNRPIRNAEHLKKIIGEKKQLTVIERYLDFSF
ncbi:MAG: radical SAM protein [Candidatus Methanomethylicia archaeon]|nr:radical SAM protein [Candidatus Methanomethylicia archaeon]MCX8169095.1 radical SAM protein [Candidatus Methanomethylicia archaeon]MDW7988827.1 radical SAM protein [Nitrososphaerota archaeon]